MPLGRFVVVMTGASAAEVWVTTTVNVCEFPAMVTLAERFEPVLFAVNAVNVIGPLFSSFVVEDDSQLAPEGTVTVHTTLDVTVVEPVAPTLPLSVTELKLTEMFRLEGSP